MSAARPKARLEARLEAVAAAARAWREPEHPDRAAAVEATLAAPNRFTEEGLAFALNHAMHALTPEALRAWQGAGRAPEPRTVGVVLGASPPLSGLRAWLAVTLLGHRFVGTASEASSVLLPAFVRAAEASLPERSRFVEADRLAEEAEAVVVAEGAEMPEGLAPELPVWHEEGGMGVAVLGGRESAEERSGLAVDVLLHEGTSSRSIHLAWAPAGLDPDPYLDALAGFREVFPPHPSTDGSLRMPAAFLEAAGQGHALGPGFLVSKGAPEAPEGAHLRWAEYASWEDVERWLRDHRSAVAFLVAGAALRRRLEGLGLPVVEPGDAHRPPLLEGDGGLRRFLLALG